MGRVTASRRRGTSAVAVVIAAGVGAGSATAAPVEAGSGPPTTAPAVPDGFQWVEDDTHTIGVAIPLEWTVDPGAAVVAPGKLPIVAISARAPGPPGDEVFLQVSAYPVHGIPQPWDPSGCDPMVTECAALISAEPYDDGSFAGYRQTLEGCCASGIFDEVEANAHDGSLAIDVQLSFGAERAPDEVALFDTILGTVARVGAPMPAVAPLTDPIFPYEDVGDVPQLGSEPVRGTGCGANGQIGDTVPDGLWSGFVDVDGDAVDIDLVCIYPAATAEQFVDPSDHVIWIDGDSTIVNNNERERTMPAAADLQRRDALFDNNGNCVEAPELAGLEHSPYPAWIGIEGGEVTWVVWGCVAAQDIAAEPVPVPGGSTGANHDEAAALAADCEYAQHMVWEGDMYVGESLPSEGEPFPPEFRAAVEASRDFFEYDRTQMRSELARQALADHYTAWSDFLDGGTFTQASFEATQLAGFDAVAPFQLACGLPTATR